MRCAVLVAFTAFHAGRAESPGDPFYSRNRNPITGRFGIPPAVDAFPLPDSGWDWRLVLELANHSVVRTADDRAIVLDGETGVGVLALRRGLGSGWEAGFDIPWLSHRGGCLDGFIESYHDALGLPQGNRTTVPPNRLEYRYSQAGATELELNESSDGWGDLTLVLARQLWTDSTGGRAVALQGNLELPTGDADQWLGSGSFDTALSLIGSDSKTVPSLNLNGSIGILAMTPGDVLPDRQNPMAAFGSLSAAWRMSDVLSLKIQLDGNSPLFHGVGLTPLDDWAAQLVMGGTLSMTRRLWLDLAVAEDIIVATAPDVVFHVGIRATM